MKRGRGRPKKVITDASTVTSISDPASVTIETVEGQKSDSKFEFTDENTKFPDTEKESKSSKKSSKTKVKVSKVKAQQIEAVFRIENKILASIDPELQIDDDMIELLGGAGEDPINNLIEKYAGTPYLDMIFFGLVIAGAHVPLVLKFIESKKNRNKETIKTDEVKKADDKSSSSSS